MRNIVQDFDGCITYSTAVSRFCNSSSGIGQAPSRDQCQWRLSIRKFQVAVLTPESTYIFGGNVNPESSGTKGMNWEKFGRGPSAKVQQ